MITDSFDPNSPPIIERHNFYEPDYIADKAIATFSYKVFDYVKEHFDLKIEKYVGSTNGKFPIYSFIFEGEKIIFYMSPITSAFASGFLDEVNYITGVKKFIYFGSCGVLTNEVEFNQVIIPTEAYRDEGFSYHFKKASDYINVKNSGKLEEICKKHNLPHILGKTWTTDAMLRETVNNTEKRKSEGCITVEMECSGLQSVCDYRNIDLYMFLFRGDLVKPYAWEKGNLGGENEREKQINCFETALLIAKEI